MEATPPTKTVKIEATPTSELGNGLLFKVSEPSVLVTSEPSIITTVENLALKKQPKDEIKVEIKKEEGGEEATPPVKTGYVHKLKKAWIQAYSGSGSDNPSEKNPAGDYSAPSTPSTNNRATPSPALSSASLDKKPKKTNGKTTTAADQQESDNSDSNASSSTTTTTTTTATTVKKAVKATPTSSATGRVSKKKAGPASRGGRGRGSSRLLNMNKASEDNDTLSDSDKSDDGSKDSDATTSSKRSGSTKAGTGGRRGRKPAHNSNSVPRKSGRGSKVNTDDEGSNETNNSNGNNGNPTHGSKVVRENPFNNPAVSVLKKTGESFLQDESCFKIAPKLGKCRECKWSQHNKNASSSSASIFCR
jgi:lysine-specific demethylase 3